MKTTTAQEKNREMMNGKPVLYREEARTVFRPSPGFAEKLLCDTFVLNLGDACGFQCPYCYTKGMAWKRVKPIVETYSAEQKAGNPAHVDLDYQNVVIRRRDALKVLASQLTRPNGQPRYSQDDRRVLFASSLVDPAANMRLLVETAAAIVMISEKTGWHIRLLSKSSLLAKLPEMVPAEYHPRLIFGFSTGTLDDKTCRAIEPGTASIGKRIAALHWLQDNGFRTFGMICPSLPLPQDDYEKFSKEACEAIRVDRCEHVWAEVLNLRGDNLTLTCKALRDAGLHREEAMLQRVHSSTYEWEAYARATFLSHTKNIPPEKLRFLQYVSKASAAWWEPMRSRGALLLGAGAEEGGA